MFSGIVCMAAYNSDNVWIECAIHVRLQYPCV